jgi:hypothetical protein
MHDGDKAQKDKLLHNLGLSRFNVLSVMPRSLSSQFLCASHLIYHKTLPVLYSLRIVVCHHLTHLPDVVARIGTFTGSFIQDVILGIPHVPDLPFQPRGYSESMYTAKWKIPARIDPLPTTLPHLPAVKTMTVRYEDIHGDVAYSSTHPTYIEALAVRAFETESDRNHYLSELMQSTRDRPDVLCRLDMRSYQLVELGPSQGEQGHVEGI